MNFNVLRLDHAELWREYVLADGTVYRIEDPKELRTREGSMSHRVTDIRGITHYIPAGWKVIRWDGDVIA